LDATCFITSGPITLTTDGRFNENYVVFSSKFSQADGGPEVGNLQDKQYITKAVMQMKYNMGNEKNATVKTCGNESK